MSSTREIITFQFGNYSNYIGAHWWNLQEFGFNYDPLADPTDMNHDILYREGVDLKGQTTFTPRLLLVDLDGSLKHLPENGELYNDLSGMGTSNLKNSEEEILKNVKSNILWDESQIEVIEKDTKTKPDFKKDIENPSIDIDEKEYNFSENVETWTDFLYARYHPRSVNIIKNYKSSSTKESFDTFTNGNSLWETEQFSDNFTDKIRQYIEETDNCQGFQTIFDCSNGFSGLTTKCLEHLNDDYSKTNFTIPVFTPQSILYENADEAMTDSIRVVNTAFTYSKLFEYCNLFVPLSVKDRCWRQLGSGRKFPWINYDTENLYQTSAILASFLDTISLRYRLKNPTLTNFLPGFCADVTKYGRIMSAGAISFPFPMRSDHDLIDFLDKFDGQLFTQLSPNSKIGTDYMIQSVCVRGIPQQRLKKPLQQAKEQMKMSAYKCSSISEMLQLYFQCSLHSSLSHVTAIENPMTLKKPYPLEIFNEHINLNGFLSDNIRDNGDKIKSIPTMAAIQSSNDLSETLESLHREAKRIKIAKLHRFKESGMESDDFAETLESLLQFKDNYDDNYDL